MKHQEEIHKTILVAVEGGIFNDMELESLLFDGTTSSRDQSSRTTQLSTVGQSVPLKRLYPNALCRTGSSVKPVRIFMSRRVINQLVQTNLQRQRLDFGLSG